MFSNPTIPSTIRSEKLSKIRWCPIHVSTPPSKSLYVLSICKTWVQIYLFGRATVIFKHHLVSGEGWVMAAERGRPWRCKNINWLTFASRRQFDHSLFTQHLWSTDLRWEPSLTKWQKKLLQHLKVIIKRESPSYIYIKSILTSEIKLS